VLPLLLAVLLPHSHSTWYASVSSLCSTQPCRPVMHHHPTQGRWRTAGTPAGAGMSTTAAAVDVNARLLTLCLLLLLLVQAA
jgi:hypothetical protein